MRDDAHGRDALVGLEATDVQPLRKAWQTPVVIVGTVSEDSELDDLINNDGNAGLS